MKRQKTYNKQGEEVLTRREVEAMSKKELSLALRRYNRWRRGTGEFSWSDDPLKRRPQPYCPETCGYIIDRAAKEVL